jgi:hypothetical protein
VFCQPVDARLTVKGDAGANEGGCTTTTDTNACTSTTTCHFVGGDITSNEVITVKNAGGTITGTMDTKRTFSDGGLVEPECKEDCTYTKQ